MLIDIVQNKDGSFSAQSLDGKCIAEHKCAHVAAVHCEQLICDRLFRELEKEREQNLAQAHEEKWR